MAKRTAALERADTGPGPDPFDALVVELVALGVPTIGAAIALASMTGVAEPRVMAIVA